MSQRISSNRVLLPTTEACKITGFSSTYIQRLLRNERLEGVKLGPVWLVYEDSLNAFMAQPRKRGPKGPHKKSVQDSLDTQVHHEQTERATHNGKGQQTQKGKQPSTP